MRTKTNHKYFSFDGKEFNNINDCQKYEKSYLTDEQLENLFLFFHDMPEDHGDLKTAKKPSDASEYRFEYNRYTDGTQNIHLFEYIKSNNDKPPYEPEIHKIDTYLGLTIKPDLDFYIEYNARTDDIRESVYQGETTYNIIEFHKYYNSIIDNKKPELTNTLQNLKEFKEELSDFVTPSNENGWSLSNLPNHFYETLGECISDIENNINEK